MPLSTGDIAFFAQLGMARTRPWEKYAAELEEAVGQLQAQLADSRAEANARKSVMRALIDEIKRHPDLKQRLELLQEIPDPADPARSILKIQKLLRAELGREAAALKP